MDVSKLTRGKKQVVAAQAVVGDTTVALKDFTIMFPVRFEDSKLASVGATVYVVGHYVGIVDDAYYSPCSANAMLSLSPTSIGRQSVNGEDYYVLFFAKGSVICPNVNLVKQDILTSRIYNYFISAGRVPWYMNYLDMLELFKSAQYHAGVNIGENQEIIELVVAMMSRSPEAITSYYRQTVQTLDEVQNRPAVFIPLKSILGATNATSRTVGSYMTEGIIGELANPSDELERIEKILRS